MERRAYLLSARAVPLLVGLAGLSGCFGEALGPTLGGAGVAELMSVKEDVISYSHAQHLTFDVACLDCHPGIDHAQDLSENHLPDHYQCAKCHEEQVIADCAYCHTDSRRARRSPPRDDGIVFNHAKHMERTRANCIRCHADIPNAASAAESHIPEMATCTDGCHKSEVAEGRCDGCHQDLTRYSLDSIRFMAHGGSFSKRHGDAAASQGASCAQCHERSFCSDCHSNGQVVTADTRLFEATTRSFIHPAPYESLHIYDSHAKRETCESCHRPSFCSSCHAARGVSGLVTQLGGQHPAGWLEPMSPSFHGVEARRSITSCAGCHDQGAASACVRCHQVGGTGGNPHPPGFTRRDQPTENRMCRTCHWR